jgi:hypothetical protein
MGQESGKVEIIGIFTVSQGSTKQRITAPTGENPPPPKYSVGNSYNNNLIDISTR